MTYKLTGATYEITKDLRHHIIGGKYDAVTKSWTVSDEAYETLKKWGNGGGAMSFQNSWRKIKAQRIEVDVAEEKKQDGIDLDTRIIDHNKNYRPLREVVKGLVEAKATIQKLTNEFGIKIQQDAINARSAAIEAAGFNVDQAIDAYNISTTPQKPQLTEEQKRKKLERDYDWLHNEGYEGYNPYRNGSSHTY